LIFAVFAVMTASQALTQTRAVAQTNAPTAAPADQFKGMLTTYCVGCHNATGKAGGLVLETMTLDAVPEHPEIWEAAARKLRGRQMPPPGSKQPDQKEIDGLLGMIQTRLDTASKNPKAGHVSIQRLNRTEYVAAVKDLVGVELKAKEILPTDIEVDGFDNIAAALSVSGFSRSIHQRSPV
jgi:mono/diheme cytochrome c family protein